MQYHDSTLGSAIAMPCENPDWPRTAPGSAVTAKELPNGYCKTLGIARFALPNHQNAPTKTPKLLKVLCIPLLIPSELRKPVLYSGFWDVRVYAACVLMPEATPHFDNLL
jgi:hypothetical protein